MVLPFKTLTLCLFYQILPTLFAEEIVDSVEIKLRKKQTQMKDDNGDKLDNPQYQSELKAGNPSDLFGANQHYSYPTVYKDFGRRFVPQYPYTEKDHVKNSEESVEVKNKGKELLPIKASPEKVLSVAMKSAMDQALNPVNQSEVIKNENEILRTGDYWNALWVEDVPKSVLRSYSKKHLEQEAKKKDRLSRSSLSMLGAVRAKIMPGSKLYQLVSVLQQYSPRLLYVINNKQ